MVAAQLDQVARREQAAAPFPRVAEGIAGSFASKIGWLALAVLGAFCLGTVALHRGETINAVWLVVAAVSILFIAYRFYSRFIDEKALRPDPTRATPAWRRNDGLDYVPTDKHVVFGHHFAAIAGAGPLVGPVLAAQMGYLPGTLWILVGVIFAGAVQDFMVLFFSMRRGKSPATWRAPNSVPAPARWR